MNLSDLAAPRTLFEGGGGVIQCEFLFKRNQSATKEYMNNQPPLFHQRSKDGPVYNKNVIAKTSTGIFINLIKIYEQSYFAW